MCVSALKVEFNQRVMCIPMLLLGVDNWAFRATLYMTINDALD